jgi:hypothetical protein
MQTSCSRTTFHAWKLFQSASARALASLSLETAPRGLRLVSHSAFANATLR